MSNADSSARFAEALSLAASNLVADAVVAFREIVERWPDDDLADDALFNVGACYLAMSQSSRAITTFQQVIERYPEATIHDADHRGESGRTAAKAWLGLVAAHLGQGNMASARQACEKLASYADSKVSPPGGIPRTFHDIGLAILASATATAAGSADHVSQADVIAG